MYLTDRAIEHAKENTTTDTHPAHHEHNDCIRIAFEWLDAQTIIKGVNRKGYALKHIIEEWAGRYVSTSDVIVAASMHPNIFGTYPDYNISSKLTKPSLSRLDGISEAFTHQYHEHLRKIYDYTVSED